MMTQACKTNRRACASIERAFQAEFFKALCDPARLAILQRLARCCRPQTVSEVASCCPTDLSVVSRHLAVLRRAGIVTAHRHGRQVCYEVDHAHLAATLRRMADAIDACCPSGNRSEEPG